MCCKTVCLFCLDTHCTFLSTFVWQGAILPLSADILCASARLQLLQCPLATNRPAIDDLLLFFCSSHAASNRSVHEMNNTPHWCSTGIHVSQRLATAHAHITPVQWRGVAPLHTITPTSTLNLSGIGSLGPPPCWQLPRHLVTHFCSFET